MRNTSKYIENNVGQKPKKNYDLRKDIKSQKLYKSNVGVRDAVSRQYLENNYEHRQTGSMVPGQLVMFNYFEPKTKEELEYYDAMPVVIFFGDYVAKEGRRIIGFNLHYYPPRIRYQIMERIFQIYKPFYMKSFNNPLKTEMSHFDYKWLTEQLEKAGMEFGVRQYIPSLCSAVTPLPTEAWSKAVFTEGKFKKRTREQILKYWKNKIESK